MFTVKDFKDVGYKENIITPLLGLINGELKDYTMRTKVALLNAYSQYFLSHEARFRFAGLDFIILEDKDDSTVFEFFTVGEIQDILTNGSVEDRIEITNAKKWLSRDELLEMMLDSDSPKEEQLNEFLIKLNPSALNMKHNDYFKS